MAIRQIRYFQDIDRSFDHFVGGLLQMQTYVEAERLAGLHVDQQLEFGRLLHLNG